MAMVGEIQKIIKNPEGLLFFVFIIFCFIIAFPVWAASEKTDGGEQQKEAYIFNITYEDAEVAIGKALSEKSENGQMISVIISGKKTTPVFSYNKPVSVEIRGLRPDSSANRWSANLVVLSDGAVISALPLSGRYMIMTEVPILKKSMQNGDVITEADIGKKTFPKERIQSNVITDAGNLIGKTPARNISPDRPIRTNEIAAPTVIKKNSMVKMRYKTPDMEITATGQAISDGGIGEIVSVRNTASKKITRAVVVDANTVDVGGVK